MLIDLKFGNYWELVIALVVGLILGFFIQPIIRAYWKEVEPGPVIYSGISRDLGLIERMLYILALSFGFPAFVGIWLVFKVASKWSLWGENANSDQKTRPEETQRGRARFNVFVLGSGLSLFVAIIAVLLAKLLGLLI